MNPTNAVTGNLQLDVNLRLYKMVKDLAASQMTTMLQGLAKAQAAAPHPAPPHPFLGSKLDIYI